MGFFDIYKKNQGKRTRVATFASVMVIVLVGAVVLSNKLEGYELTRQPIIRYGVPAVVVLLFALLMFWMINRLRSADFLIATEGEMKKVSWSSRKEVFGSTKVVIITSFIIAVILFAIDLLFVNIFKALGILSS